MAIYKKIKSNAVTELSCFQFSKYFTNKIKQKIPSEEQISITMIF